MRTRVVTLVLVILSLVGGLPAAARTLQPSVVGPAAVPLADAQITLNVNLGPGDVPTLDPALAEDTSSSIVIKQLFAGLVSQDDDTGNIVPELATGWTVSEDGRTYTFTLRGDAVWSDGKKITAHDVRYGILRALEPATASGYWYVLGAITNAAAYHDGTVSDPAQVGVVALDDTHLQILLDYPTPTILASLCMWVARAAPRWAIEAHPTDWTEPANIVTSGAYRLSEWAHGDHILLEKNATYFDAANVQIERAKMWMLDEVSAWERYLNGGLDTVSVPLNASLTPLLRLETRSAPSNPGTNYYGFSITQPPFDNPLVRKAFIAATDRQGLIDSVMGGIQLPAPTFTPPVLLGHPDGVVEGVGIPYKPAQARQWLAEAGYPNGTGLPPITLWHNTSSGHRAIAEYVRDSWAASLGVTVTLKDMEWDEYLTAYKQGNFQVWRSGWNADYLDALNFLRDAIDNSRGGLGGWTNPTYEALLDQATRTADEDARKALFVQAEEILVETDAVMLPLYHYGSLVATKPYLERTYPMAGAYDISAWRDTRVQGTITPTGGGTVRSHYGDTTIQVPAGVFTDTVTIAQAPGTGLPPAGSLTGIEHVLEVTAVYSDTGQPAQPAPGTTYTVTVAYTDGEKGPVIEDTLRLYGWDGSAWTQEGITSHVDTAANRVVAQVGHFSVFAVLGETKRVYLPLIDR